MVKNLPGNAGDTGNVGSIPGSGRSPGTGNGKIHMHTSFILHTHTHTRHTVPKVKCCHLCLGAASGWNKQITRVDVRWA